MEDQKIANRFNSKIEKIESGCWIFTGWKDRQGYGSAYWKGKNIPAHRLSWIIHNGMIPKGLSVCHSCDNPSCVRIDHLWLGTPKENMLDMIRKNRKNGRKRKIILIEDISMKTNKLTINIDPKLHTDFKVICASTNQSIKDVIRQ